MPEGGKPRFPAEPVNNQSVKPVTPEQKAEIEDRWASEGLRGGGADKYSQPWRATVKRTR